MFETQGDLMSEKCQDNSPPMSPSRQEGVARRRGRRQGLCRLSLCQRHFPQQGRPWQNQARGQIDPYLAMVGGEFIGTASNRRRGCTSSIRVSRYQGSKGLRVARGMVLAQEFRTDLHVVLVQDTHGMKDFDYARPKFRPPGREQAPQRAASFFTSIGPSRGRLGKRDLEEPAHRRLGLDARPRRG